jgi:transcriptional regulator with XRE-family HTH domain
MEERTREELSRIGAQIRRERLALKLSQEDFAELADLHPTYISQIERGTVNMSWHVLAGCAHGLQLKPSTLLRRAGL